jgi:hypothetical protein
MPKYDSNLDRVSHLALHMDTNSSEKSADQTPKPTIMTIMYGGRETLPHLNQIGMEFL